MPLLQDTVAEDEPVVPAGIEPVKEPKFKSVADTVQAVFTVTFTLKLLVALAANAPLAAASIARPDSGRRYLRITLCTSVKNFFLICSDNPACKLIYNLTRAFLNSVQKLCKLFDSELPHYESGQFSYFLNEKYSKQIQLLMGRRLFRSASALLDC